jgi:rhamnosyltransferase
MPPRVSICLPTWNGERDLERLLPALAEQKVDGGFEIVAIDSSSTDKSFELLENAGARAQRIDKRDFGHGATRNRLAGMAQGEILVFLSQDAVPQGERFLATLVAAFDDPRTAGACARILPHDDDDPLTARTVLDAPEARTVPRVFEGKGGDVDACFNDVAAAIRASVFATLPFPEVEFGEDRAWAVRALAAGHRIRFVPESVVRHAHRYTPRTAFERYRIDAAYQRRVHGRCVRPSLWSVARGIGHELVRDWGHVRSTRGPWTALLRAPALRGAQVWGQWCGSRERS